MNKMYKLNYTNIINTYKVTVFLPFHNSEVLGACNNNTNIIIININCNKSYNLRFISFSKSI